MNNILSDESFYESLLNNFIKYFNSHNNTTQHMFTDINYNDKSSTNYIMEKFYNIIAQYKENTNSNKIYSDNDDSDNLHELKHCDNLYVLKYDNLKFYSQNEFPLLLKVTELNLTDWKIDPLRN